MTRMVPPTVLGRPINGVWIEAYVRQVMVTVGRLRTLLSRDAIYI